MPDGYRFWFPSSTGLGLLVGMAGETAVSLNADFELFRTEMVATTGEANTLSLKGKEVAVQPVTFAWADQTRTLWFDERQWPLRMVRSDGLTAVETRYIRYA